jgi:hypothetical protein
MKIIYTHGFRSQGNSFKSVALRERFGDDNVVYPDLPTNADATEAILDKIVKENTNFPIVFVGTSLGGFWANYIAQKYDIPCVIVNPCFKPSISLKKYGENVDGYAQREVWLENNTNGNLISLFVAKNDTVLSAKEMLAAYPHTASTTILKDGGHRFDIHWNLVVDKVSEIVKFKEE